MEQQKSSRDSLQYSSGYSTQTNTPSCSEDTIPSQGTKSDTVNGFTRLCLCIFSELNFNADALVFYVIFMCLCYLERVALSVPLSKNDYVIKLKNGKNDS